MRYVVIFEIAVLVIAAYALISQMLLPAIKGTKLFPWFRRESEIIGKIVEAKQRLRESRLTTVLNRLKKKPPTTTHHHKQTKEK